MPLVRIEIIKGHTPEYKKILLQSVHDGLAKVLKIPEGDRFQRLYELPKENFECAGKSDKFTMIELTIFPGRTKLQKRDIISEITRLLHERLKIPKEDVTIVMHEPPFENWGFAGAQKED